MTRGNLGNAYKLYTRVLGDSDDGDSGSEIRHTTYPASGPLGGGSLRAASNLVYQYIVITGCRHRRELCCLSVLLLSGALASFIYATSLGFYKSPSRLLLRVALLGLLHIGPSRARYTNNGYPKGMPMSIGANQFLPFPIFRLDTK